MKKLKKNKYLISAIVPCFNSKKYILKNILKLNNTLKKINNFNYEIIIIDDGSIDITYQLLISHFSQNKKIVILKNHKNMGKGYSIKRGLNKSRGEYIFFIDADLPYFKKINVFINTLIKKKPKILIAKRTNKIKGNLLFNVRTYLSDLFALFTKYAVSLEYSDTQAGLKGFNKNILNKINKYKTNGFVFDLEILIIAKIKKIKVKEIDVISKVKDYNSHYTIQLGFYFYIIKDLIKVLYNYIFNKY